MDDYGRFRGRGLLAAVWLALGLALASCAVEPTGPGGAAGSPPPSDGADSTSRSGRVMLTVVDQNGVALPRATVELRALGKINYRASGATNDDGRVNFVGVPTRVEVSVTHQRGSYYGMLDVPQTGPPMDARIMVQTSEPLPTDPSMPLPGGIRR